MAEVEIVKAIGDRVVSTWSDHITGTVVGYGTLFIDGEMRPVYLVDMGATRMFDLKREPKGPPGARILTMRCDRVRA